MTIQQRLFSFREHVRRRGFWTWTDLWIVGMLVLFSLANKQLLDIQTTAFCLVCLLWPTAAVTVKRLHDRGRSRAWTLLMILAWVLLAGNWVMLPSIWQWMADRFVPTLILVGMFIDLGTLIDTQDTNKYGKGTQDVKHRADLQIE